MIRAKNRAARVAFARRHLHWCKADWRKVLFSDDSKFNMFGSDGVKYVRCPSGQRFNQNYITPTMKHGGGSVIVYGAFSLNGMGPLLRIEGTMTGQYYKDMMVDKVIPWANQNMPSGWILQQDNVPKHVSKVTKAAFQQHGITVLEWPSQSPDLNPIEHLWQELENHVRKKTSKNSNEKFALLKKEWDSMPVSVI